MNGGIERTLSALLVNLTVVIWTAVCVRRFYTRGGEGNMKVRREKCFQYFTVDSNILAAIAALALLPSLARMCLGGEGELPMALRVLKFTGTSAVTVTMLTVLFFLGPTQGYKRMLSGDNLYMHLIGPVLSVGSLCFLEKGAPLPTWVIWFGVLPTVIYGCVYLVLVIPTKKWEDFYGFNHGGLWYVSMAVMFAGSWGIAALLRLLCNL